MEKKEAFKIFFKLLKTSLKNASIYSATHPAFLDSVKNLKDIMDILIGYINPLTIGFTPNSLYIEGNFWEKEKIHRELARLFHYRKIKVLEVQQDIPLEELVKFISKIALSHKDYIREGGIDSLISREELSHISIEELDYSELLKGEGEEIKEIWTALLQDALQQQDKAKILEFADSFEKNIKRFEPEDIIENPELREAISGFLSYLEANDPEKFSMCAKDLTKVIIGKKDLSPDLKLEKIRSFIKGMKADDYASTLWEEILTNDDFDPVNFNIFSQLIEKDAETQVASSISLIYKENVSINSHPQVKLKMEELLSSPNTNMISPVYRNTLNLLLRDLSFQDKITFDQNQLSKNYHFILLHLLDIETDKDQCLLFLKKILNEGEKLSQQRDLEYLRILFSILNRKKDLLSSEPDYKKLINIIAVFIEKSILSGELSLYFEYFITNMEKSCLDVNKYLDKIFTEGHISPYIFKAYFKFFKDYMLYFNINLEEYSSDVKFMEKFISNLKLVDDPLSLATLKIIYPKGNIRVKQLVLTAMQNLSTFDQDFLFPILKIKNSQLKAEALIILMKDKDLQKKALERLFNIQSPFGFRNKQLLEHTRIVAAKGLRDAEKYLIDLSRRKHFWNKKLREESLSILEKWHER